MRHLAMITLLSAAGLFACNKTPLGPTAASSTPGSTAAAPAPATATPGSVDPGSTDPSTGPDDCVQTGENSGECGSQAADGTETPGTETPEGSAETPGSEN